jgi:hypothetical protein
MAVGFVKPDDYVLEGEDYKVVVDPKSMSFLNSMQVVQVQQPERHRKLRLRIVIQDRPEDGNAKAPTLPLVPSISEAKV